MLSFARGEYFALAFRRGITHGWPALLVLPFAVAGGVLAWDRVVRRRRDPGAEPARPGAVLVLAAIGLLTHPSLDWLNIYGMRWGLPFDGAWTYGDALFIIDPWVWLALGGAVFLSADPRRRGLAGWTVLATLTTALIVLGVGGAPALVWIAGLGAVLGARRRFGPGRGPERRGVVRLSLAAVVSYIALMIGADLAARTEVTRVAAADGLAVRDVMIAPTRGNPLVTDVEVVTDDALVPGSHAWHRTPRLRLRHDDAVRFLSAPGVESAVTDRVVEVARRRPEVRNYLVWARLPYVQITRTPDGWEVLHADARYDSQPEAAGLAGVRVHVTEAELR